MSFSWSSILSGLLSDYWSQLTFLNAILFLNDSDLQHTPMMAQYCYETALNTCIGRGI